MSSSDFSSPRAWWTVQRGAGPIVATAIHDGHALRPEVAAAMKLADADRLREEDPIHRTGGGRRAHPHRRPCLAVRL